MPVAANTEGRRETIGLGVGLSEAETFCTEFLRSLRAPGLRGDRFISLLDERAGFIFPNTTSIHATGTTAMHEQGDSDDRL